MNKKEVKIKTQDVRETGYVFLVRQTQPEADYWQYTIYVCSDEDEAIRRARELNKTYGKGCKFSPDYDYEEIDWDNVSTDDDYHYYDVEECRIDGPFYN